MLGSTVPITNDNLIVGENFGFSFRGVINRDDLGLAFIDVNHSVNKFFS